MAKRFTDTEKWKKPFIKELSTIHKIVWFYILDECDHSGVWEVEEDVLCARLKEDISLEAALKCFGDKIRVIENGRKWFIQDFVDFQYGELNENNRLHVSVIQRLKKYGVYKIKPLTSPLEGAKDKDKNKDKDKEKEGVFEEFWKLYPSRNGRKLLKREALKQFAKLDEATIPEVLKAVKNYVASGQMPKDAPRFLKDDYWREWVTTARTPEKLSVKTEMPNRLDQPRWNYPPEVQALVKNAIPGGK